MSRNTAHRGRCCAVLEGERFTRVGVLVNRSSHAADKTNKFK